MRKILILKQSQCIDSVSILKIYNVKGFVFFLSISVFHCLPKYYNFKIIASSNGTISFALVHVHIVFLNFFHNVSKLDYLLLYKTLGLSQNLEIIKINE